jgi:hypothetical protein
MIRSTIIKYDLENPFFLSDTLKSLQTTLVAEAHLAGEIST